MAQRVLDPPKMPELQLRQELRNRFPEISQMTLIQVMRLVRHFVWNGLFSGS
jgi:hypothetical protein